MLFFSVIIVQVCISAAEINIQSSRDGQETDREDLSVWGYEASIQHVTITESITKFVPHTVTVKVTQQEHHNTICPSPVKTLTIERTSTIYVQENNTVTNHSESIPFEQALQHINEDQAPSAQLHLDIVIALSSLSVVIVILTFVIVVCAAKASQMKKNTRGLSKKIHQSFKNHIFRDNNTPIIRETPIISHPHMEPQIQEHEYVILEELNRDVVTRGATNTEVVVYPTTDIQTTAITVKAQVYDTPENAEVQYEVPLQFSDAQ